MADVHISIHRTMRWLIRPRWWLPLGVIGWRLDAPRAVVVYGLVIGTPLLSASRNIHFHITLKRKPKAD